MEWGRRGPKKASVPEVQENVSMDRLKIKGLRSPKDCDGSRHVEEDKRGRKDQVFIYLQKKAMEPEKKVEELTRKNGG